MAAQAEVKSMGAEACGNVCDTRVTPKQREVEIWDWRPSQRCNVDCSQTVTDSALVTVGSL